jgi:membrane-associated phospholipid phosphatase
MDVAAGPRTWRAAAREAGIVLAALAPCPLVALLAPAVRGEALARGAGVARLERSVGLLSEPAVHAWASGRPLLLHAAWALYVFAHLPALVGALAWAWLERPRAYAAARSVFVLAQGLTVAGYLVLPSAPPQYVPAAGGHAPPAGGAERLAHLVQSPWAALPSGHVVFATVAAGIVIALARPPAVRVLAGLYPVLVIAVTIVTGNHFWLDAAAGVLVAVVSGVLVVATARRPSPRLVASRPARG